MLNIRNICSSLLLNGRSFSRFWGLALALFLAFLSRETYCETVVVETGPFTDSTVLTNIVFVSQSDFEAFASYCRQQCVVVRGDIDEAISRVHIIVSISDQVASTAMSIIQSDVDTQVSSQARNIYNKTSSSQQAQATSLNIPRVAGLATNSLQSAKSDVSEIETALDSVTLYSAVVGTSSTESGSGCNCPDYSSVLSSIQSVLNSIHADLSSLLSAVQSMYTDVHNIAADVSSLDSNVSTISQNVTLIRNKLNALETKLNSIDTRLDGINTNLYTVNTYLSDLYNLLHDDVLYWLEQIHTAIGSIDTTLTSFVDDVFGQYRTAVDQYWTQQLASWSSVNNITNHLLGVLYIEALQDWLGRGDAGLTDFPLRYFSDFFGKPKLVGWGLDADETFREFFEYRYIDPILSVYGFRDPSDFAYPDEIRNYEIFVAPLHSVVSNLYETSRPEGVRSRGLLYDLWAEGLDQDANIPGMPNGDEVAHQPMADAVIGLLYRIQYLLSLHTEPTVYTNTLPDAPRPVVNIESQINSLEFFSPSTTNLPFLRVYASMQHALQNLKSSIPDGVVADTWLVLYPDGFTLEFAGSQGDPLITGTDKPIYFQQPDFNGGKQSTFFEGVATVMGCVWYGVASLVALTVTLFAFRFSWIAVTFTIAVIGGDFSTAVGLFGDIGKSLGGE